VLFVTNLNDSGEGSLRAACGAEGPRMVVFRVSGLIRLKTPIEVVNPYMTLAGQSAPGDGVCLRDGTFMISTHDVVVRFLRSRLGDVIGRPEDCISVGRGAHHVVLDHCSATWSVDECLSLDGRRKRDRAVVPHRRGPGLQQAPKASTATGPNAGQRSGFFAPQPMGAQPRAQSAVRRQLRPGAISMFDFRNNAIYGYGEICTGLTQGRFRVNYVANFIRPGPDSRADHAIKVGAPSDMFFSSTAMFSTGTTPRP